MTGQLPKLPFEAIREKLDDLITAVSNKLEREWHISKWKDHPGAAVILRATVIVSRNTYDSIRYFSADKPLDVFRKIEFGLSVSPLARTILDSVFTIVFMFEDLPVRYVWFEKSGWREVYEENQRYQTRYGNDPDWADYLAERANFLDQLKKESGILPSEEADPKSIPWWPIPGQMIRHASTSTSRKDYLSFLNDWFYKQLSAASHLSWPGLARRSAPFFAPDEETKEQMLIKMRSDAVMTTITLIIALLSEIEIELKFDLSTRLKYLWGILCPYWGPAKDLYDMRYEKLL